MKNKNSKKKLSPKIKEIKREEKYFIEIFDNHPSIMLLINPETGKIIKANKSAVKFYGYTKKEFSKLHIFDINQLTQKEVLSKMQNVMNNEVNYFIFPHKLKNGEIKYVEVHSASIIYKNKNVLFSTINNITDKKKNEDTLQLSEESYKNLFNSVIDAIYIQDENGYFIDVNEGAVKMYGYQKEYFIGKTPEFLSALGKNDLNDVLKKVKKSFNGEPQRFEFWGKKKNGEIFPKEIVLTKGKYFGKDVVYAIARDISEIINTQIKLEKSEKKYKEFIESLPQPIFEADLNGNVIYGNKACFEIFKFVEDDFKKGINIFQVIDSSDFERAKSNVQILLKNNINHTNEYLLVRNNGEKFNSIIYTIPISSDNKIVGLRGIILDITQIKQYEKQLVESNNLFNTLMENLHAGLIAEDENRKVLFCNKNFCEIFGIKDKPENLVGANSEKASESLKYLFIEEKEFVNNINNLIKNKIPINNEEINLKDGRTFERDFIPISIKDKLYCNLWIYNDITERKNLIDKIKLNEERLNEAQHLTKLGYWEWDIQNDIIHWSDEVYNIFNISKDNIITFDKFLSFVHDDDKDFVLKSVNEALYQNKKYDIDHRIVLSNGEVRYCHEKAKAEFDSDQKLIKMIGTIQDITERKLIELALQESENKFRTLTEKALVGIYIIQENVFRYLNDTALKIIEYSAEEIIDKLGPTDISISDYKKFVQNNIEKRIKGEVSSIQYEDIILTKNGNEKIVDILGTVTTFNNKPAIIGTFIDITERKKYEEEIYSINQLLQNILNNIPQRIFWKDKNSVYQGANLQFIKDIGLNSIDDLVGKNDYQFFESKSSEKYREDDQLVINTKQPKLNYEEEQIDLNTKLKRWVRTNKIPLYDQDGNIIGVLGTYEDITEIKEALDRIKMFSRIIEQSPVNIAITDLSGKIIYTNLEFTKITGYKIEEVLGKNSRIFQSGFHTKEFYENLWNTILSGNKWEGEFYDKKKDGTYYWEKAIIFPFFNDQGEIFNFVKIGEDITLKKEYELGLIQAKEKAEELNQLKTNFLANMSHELRTPLVGILGFADILRMELPENEYRDMADKIKQSSKRLMDTLNLILDLSKIEFNKVEVNKEIVKLRLLLRECYENFKPYVDIENLKLNLLINEPELFLKSDERMLKVILDNLINNAIKFTKEGEITIEENIITKDEKEWISIKIQDTGIGITKENLSIIFEEFRQVSEGLSRGFEGAGLGLTISKKYVELLGGKIEVESKVGEGSTFTVLLPYQNLNYQYENDLVLVVKDSITDFAAKLNRKILIVEDDDITIELLKLYLKNYYDFDIAQNGTDAILLVSQNKYDAILMDINLGIGIDGLEVTKEIRKLASYEKIPIVAMTAYAMAGDKESFIEAGCNHYISKPFPKQDLLNLLNKILS